MLFQFTHKKRGRQYYTVQDISQMKFQSTPPKRCNGRGLCRRYPAMVSIHAPKGCDWNHRLQSATNSFFNPRTPKGATTGFCFFLNLERVSIHAPKGMRQQKNGFTVSFVCTYRDRPHRHVFSYSCRDSLKFPLLSSMLLIAKKDVHYTLALRTISRHTFRHRLI